MMESEHINGMRDVSAGTSLFDDSHIVVELEMGGKQKCNRVLINDFHPIRSRHLTGHLEDLGIDIDILDPSPYGTLRTSQSASSDRPSRANAEILPASETTRCRAPFNKPSNFLAWKITAAHVE
jgi:hypothetical protein